MVTKKAQINFRLDDSLNDRLKAHLEQMGIDCTKLMVKLIENHLANDESKEATSAAVPNQTAQSFQPIAGESFGLQQLRLDILSLANHVISLELRLADCLRLLEPYGLKASTLPTVMPGSSQCIAPSSEPLANYQALENKLASVETLLDQYNKRQSEQEHNVQQIVADAITSSISNLDNQLTQQGEHIAELKQLIVVQQQTHTDILSGIESLFVQSMAQLVANPSTIQPDIPEHPLARETAQELPGSSGKRITTRQNSQFKNKASTTKNNKGQSRTAPPTSVQASTSAFITIDGDVKKLLFPQEAYKIAQANGFSGSNEQFRKIGYTKDIEKVKQKYAQFGLGVVPERKGSPKQPGRWFYELGSTSNV